METINLMGKNVPVMGNSLGVYALVSEVISGGLLARCDVYVESWDGIFAVWSIDSDLRALVTGGNGATRTVYLNSQRELAVFFRGV